MPDYLQIKNEAWWMQAKKHPSNQTLIKYQATKHSGKKGADVLS
jgi:hypothetical protein